MRTRLCKSFIFTMPKNKTPAKPQQVVSILAHLHDRRGLTYHVLSLQEEQVKTPAAKKAKTTKTPAPAAEAAAKTPAKVAAAADAPKSTKKSNKTPAKVAVEAPKQAESSPAVKPQASAKKSAKKPAAKKAIPMQIEPATDSDDEESDDYSDLDEEQIKAMKAMEDEGMLHHYLLLFTAPRLRLLPAP
jgi:hypothetical protein